MLPIHARRGIFRWILDAISEMSGAALTIDVQLLDVSIIQRGDTTSCK